MLTIFRNVIRLLAAFGLAFYFQSHYFPEGYWVILSVFFGMSLQNKFYYDFPTLGLLATAFAAGIAMLLATLFSYNFYIYLLFLSLVAYFGVMFGYEERKYWQHAMVIILYTVISAVLLTNFHGALMRFNQVLLGFLIAIVVRKIFFVSLREKKRLLIKKILLDANGYLQAVFTAMIQRNYQSDSFQYEKTFHLCRKRLLTDLSYLHQLLLQNQPKHYDEIEAQLHKLYENIASLANTLLRIEDAAIFEMASKELLTMANACQEILTALANNEVPKKIDVLAENIQQLQEVNVGGVQLVAQDPLLFFLFIEDWKLLERRFELLHGVTS